MRRLVVALVMMVLLVSVVNMARAVAEANMVLYFNFSEGSGDVVTDVSGSGNNGTIHGSADWVAGKFGTGLAFDGVDDFVEVPNSRSLNPADEITTAAWIKPTANFLRYNHTICKWNYSGDLNKCYEITLNEGHPWTVVANEDNAEGIAKSETALELNQWAHVAGTYDGSQIKVYLNGQEEAAVDFSGKIAKREGSVIIGTNDNGLNLAALVTGTIDEVFIYNRALSAGEIEQLMTVVSAVKPSGKLATSWGSIRFGY